MLRLHKTRPAKSGDQRIEFKFSHFKALQVPGGWDRLFVSIISVETGKIIAKSSKALARNATCQWTETISESIRFSQEDSPKELEDFLFKLVVSMGSARSGILGETIVNMKGYMNSRTLVPVSLPLNKCKYGTILQVKIHCLAPRKLREDESKETNSHEENLNGESPDIDTKSDESDNITRRSIGSSSDRELGFTSHKEEPESRGTSFSASGSHHSYDSIEGSVERQNFSSRNNLSGDDGDNLIGRQYSTSSLDNLPKGHVDEPSESNHSSFDSQDTNSGIYSENNQRELAISSFGISSSSKSLLGAAEDTIEELRAESKMWERSSQKFMLDLEILKKEFSNQSKNQTNLEMELSAACTERDGFRNEVERMKSLLEKSMVNPTSENSAFQDEGATHVQKELEDEIKFQKESNANLSMQLKRSQEANIDLVTVLQELEETIEKQKLEIENLSSLQSKFSSMESSIQVNIEENKKLVRQLQQLQESEKSLHGKVQLLEQALAEKNHLIENNQTLLVIETEYKAKLSAKDDEIASLNAKLSVSTNGGDADPNREIEQLKAKLLELEMDCNELTDENLELLFKLKEMKNHSAEDHSSLTLSAGELLENSSSSLRSEVSDDESDVHNLEEKLTKKVFREIENDYDVSVQQLEFLKNELEDKATGLAEELSKKMAEVERLKAKMLSKDEEINDLRYCRRELEAKVANLHKGKIHLEENMETVSRESDIATKCLNDLQNDILMLSSTVDSNISANKTLENKCSELESVKRELELHLSEVEHENAELSLCVSGLESQLRFLTDETESKRLELQNSNSLAMNLQDEVTRLRNEMENQKLDMKQKLEGMRNWWSEAQEECESLRRETSMLQATAESLVEEGNSIQKSNEELRKEKFELKRHCTTLEAELKESNENFASCSRKVESLEENLSSMLEDIATKEKSLTSQLDALIDGNGKQNEKLILAERLFNQMHFEKTAEVENFQQEIRNLAKQLSETCEERERMASEAEHEISGLRADKSKLESALQELQSKAKCAEIELDSFQTESETKVQVLAASKQNQEMLMAKHEKVLKLLETYRSKEERYNTTLNDLELKLTVSEYEKQQLMEESTGLKVQLLRVEHLEEEVLSLKNELNAIKSEKEKLNTSLHLISRECDDLKVQKASFLEKISTLQKDVSELEGCKRDRVTLEEKLLKMEGDLIEKEELCAQDTELKNELSWIKRANRQFQWKIQQLEDEKDKCVMRAKALEDELNLVKEERQNEEESISKHPREDNEYSNHNESSFAMEANSMYKVQVHRLSPESGNSPAKARKKPFEGEIVTKERFERTKSSLETELRDIRERYLQMSLKYAEVEAEREELVMKLKTWKNGNWWLS